ncbi:porin family protein [Mucilaginibacter aquatilis]|uniref:Outer membrane protein beta-barrel domain-containing protein n=1 Tax=Mucilaginibacter aquatilis TaxID=1517760 RepID=A0A6I4IAG2_9SPHI|nr:hypothetical protein [Mucilaginibacter aquatilis]MVN90958.1 hypothetical protein [Mucilaginibacter aquatilis]
MKNSAWYNKLWRKKLKELPVKTDADAAWLGMQKILDVHLPVQTPATAAPAVTKPLIAKVISVIGYVLPAAAMVGAATWFAVKPPVKQKLKDKTIEKKERIERHKPLASDSLVALKKLSGDTLNTSTPATNKDSLDIQNLVSVGEDKSGAELRARVLTGKSDEPVSPLGNNYDSQEKAYQKNITQKSNGDKAKEPSSIANNIDYNPWQKLKHSRKDIAQYPQQLFNYIDAVYQSSIPIEEEVPLKVFVSKKNGHQMKVLQPPVLAGWLPEKEENNQTALFAKAGKQRKWKGSLAKELNTPSFNIGAEAGLNIAKNTSIYGGLTANMALSQRLLIGSGIRINLARQVSGSYSHPSFFKPDSSSAFTVNEKHKILVTDIPLILTYKVNKLISIKGGAVASFAGKLGNQAYSFGAVAGVRDTLGYTKTIDTLVSSPVLTKRVSLGIVGGIAINFKQFSIEARYIGLKPYRVNNAIGSYTQSNKSVQLGVTYWLKQYKRMQ